MSITTRFLENSARHVVFFTCVIALTLTACNGSAAEPEPDRPRYTKAHAKAIIVAEARASTILIGVACANEGPRYRGDGIWECGDHWTVDERTGKAVWVR